MNKLIIILIIIFSLFIITSTVSAFEIIINKESKIKHNNILLGNIAKFKDVDQKTKNEIKDINLGKAPLPGYNKYINKSLIKLLIKQKGYSIDNIKFSFPDRLTIKRDFKLLDNKKVDEFIKKEIKKKYSGQTDKLEIKVNMPNRKIKIPNQHYELRLLKDKINNSGQLTLPISIIIEGEEYKRLFVPINLKIYQYAYIADKYIQQGTKINKDDFTYKKVEVNNFNNHNIVNEDSDIFNNNIVLSYTLKKGDILRNNNYNTTQVINWGDSVNAIINVGEVSISLMVIARERGKIGEYISVENPKTKYRFKAKIISSQLVELTKK